MSQLRIIGDVHGQIDDDDLVVRGKRPYLTIIADAEHSVQIGDMGDGETYGKLIASVDAARHRFFPGNHDHHGHFPPHNLRDFGEVTLGGVSFFFVRGALSTDKDKLIRLGRELGKTLWYEQEELTDDEMQAAEAAYLQSRPQIMLTHDGPTEMARFAWRQARSLGPPNPDAVFRPSRTTEFLTRLLEQHRPRLWAFGHHHRDWRYRDGETQFACIGELSYIDVDAEGNVNF